MEKYKLHNKLGKRVMELKVINDTVECEISFTQINDSILA